jgi:hypothetical protein
LRYSEAGIGARITFNVTDYLAAEGEFGHYPLDRSASSRGFKTHHRNSFLFGVKSGMRLRRLGFFGKINLGRMRFSRASGIVTCPAVYPLPLGCVISLFGETAVATDVGGGVEFYPSSDIVLRVDVADRILHFPGPYLDADPVGSLTSHNFHTTIGVAFRFLKAD